MKPKGVFMANLPKFNMEPENDGFQVRNLQTSRGEFSGEACLTSGVYPPSTSGVEN